MKRIALLLASMSAFILGLAGCGGGGGSTPNQQKTAIIIFSTISSAHTAPLQGIELTTRLPAGASVSNIATALVGRNDTGQIALSTYNPPAVSFIVQPISSAPIKFGPFAQLTCDVAPGTTLNQNSFTVALADLQMTGTDSNGNTVNLVPEIPLTLSVSFGF